MTNQLTNYIKAGYPGLFIVSHEEQRVEAILKPVAADVQFRLFAWSITGGIVDTSNGASAGAEDPLEMLDQFNKLPEKSILLARDFHMFLADPNPLLFRKLKDSLIAGKNSNRVLIMVGCHCKLPPELEKEVTVIDFALPGRTQLLQVLETIAQSAGHTLNGNTDPILDAASGLTTIEAENAFALSFIEAGQIQPDIVAREKANGCSGTNGASTAGMPDA